MFKKFNTVRDQKGFTLIELLIVIAIIAILAAVVFVALDPLKRFQDARDARRWADVDGLISAIKLDQVDNRGSYATDIAGLTNNVVFMIGTAAAGCNIGCDPGVGTPAAACKDIEAAADDIVFDGYIAALPVSPNDGVNTWAPAMTGYTIKRNGNNITVAACVSEGASEIKITR